MKKYYLLSVGRNKDHDNVMCRIDGIVATSSQEAHIFAANEYRKTYRLTPNIHVVTRTLYESDNAEEVILFLERLVAEMEKSNADKTLPQ